MQGGMQANGQRKEQGGFRLGWIEQIYGRVP
jgi:hypothetical protein